MPLGSERVVPHFRERGLVPTALLGFGLWGVLLNFSERYGSELMNALGQTGMILLLIHLAFLPYAAAGAVIGRLTPRWKPLVRAVLVGTLALWATAELSSAAAQPAGGAEFAMWARWSSLLMPLFFGAVGMGIAAVFRILCRAALSVPIEQTEPARLCWRCGYDLGAAPPALCPECATPWNGDAHPTRRDAAAARALLGFSRFALPVAILAGIAWCAFVITTQTIPGRRFLRSFPSDGPIILGCYIDGRIGSPNLHIGRNPQALGRWITPADKTGRRVLISFNPTPEPGFPAMQLRIANDAPALWDAGYSYASFGYPTIVADLTAEQARNVLSHGVPPALVDALTAKANEIGWSVAGAASSIQRVCIDPAPFLADHATKQKDRR